MTIIFSNSGDIDCSLLPLMWKGLNATVVEITPTTEDWEVQVAAAIADETDTLILAGHGTQYGLLFPNLHKGDYIIHENNVKDIRAARVFCCWCNASDFCTEYYLRSVATSMFIFNVEEAYNYGYYGYEQADINAVCKRFYNDVRNLLSQRVPMSEWLQTLQQASYQNGIDVFNRQGVCEV